MAEQVTIAYDDLCTFRSTEKSWCITYGSLKHERDVNARFIPKGSSVLNPGKKEITMPEWMAIKKGLDQYAVG